MELSIDTASEMASVCLSEEGRPLAEITWCCRRNHTVELLPTIERLFGQAACAKTDLTAVFVCTGPGTYTGLRVGMSVAKGLASALGLPVVGVGRLELDAYPHAAFPCDIAAVHSAGRGDLAWAVYRGSPWREVHAPRLSRPEELVAALIAPALVVGEVDDALRELLSGRADIAIAASAASLRHASVIAELGLERLQRGETGDAFLAPVYLRPPAIGPQSR